MLLTKINLEINSNTIVLLGAQNTRPWVANRTNPQFVILTELNPKYQDDKDLLAKGTPADMPLENIRAMHIPMCISGYGLLELMEARLERAFHSHNDAVGKSKVKPNVVTLVFTRE